MLLLLLSRFSRVRLRATPQTAAHQARPSLGVSRQEHWSGLPFPSPMHESEKWKWSRSVVLTPSDAMDCSPPGSSIHGILQARVLDGVPLVQWFSNIARHLGNLEENSWYLEPHSSIVKSLSFMPINQLSIPIALWGNPGFIHMHWRLNDLPMGLT